MLGFVTKVNAIIFFEFCLNPSLVYSIQLHVTINGELFVK